mgnify:CR=1 FL=1
MLSVISSLKLLSPNWGCFYYNFENQPECRTIELMIKLYNTLTGRKDELKPLDGETVKFYTCGLTVYSQPHIGNWVGYIYWDVLVRLLRWQDIPVIRTQNITDVGHLTSDDDNGEDKMEKGARREGKTAWDVAERYISVANHEAYDVLKLIKPEIGRGVV